MITVNIWQVGKLQFSQFSKIQRFNNFDDFRDCEEFARFIFFGHWINFNKFSVTFKTFGQNLSEISNLKIKKTNFKNFGLVLDFEQ